LLESRINFFTGKGGVGKSFISLAAAMESAQSGHRTLLVELGEHDQASQIADGVDRLSYEPTQLFPDLPLFACRITVPEALEEYGVLKLKFKRAYRLVFENDMVRRMLDLLPGMDELLILGKLWYMDQDRDSAGAPVWDRIVVDTPATGHGLSLLSLPHAILSTVESGAFARETRPMLDMLREPGRSVVHLVTLPEELPMRETRELAAQIQGVLGIPLGTCLINKVWETAVAADLRAWLQERNVLGAEPGSGAEALTRYLCRAISRQEHQARYISEIRSSLADLTITEVPYLFKENLERCDMAALQLNIFSAA